MNTTGFDQEKKSKTVKSEVFSPSKQTNWDLKQFLMNSE